MRINGTRWGVLPVLAIASVATAQNNVPLIDAVKARDTSALRALLQQRVDVNLPQPDGATALHWAVHFDDLETAGLLVRAGAHATAVNDLGVAPLTLACINGNAAMVEMLLKAGAHPDTALPTGETALMTAARTGNPDVVNVLVTSGANVNAKETTRGQTPLMWAAAEGHADVARFLILHGADVHARSTAGFTPLLFVARDGDLDTTRVLLSAGADINEASSDGTTALVIATVRGHTAYGAFLLEQGANPNLGPGFNPLHWAAGEWTTGLTGVMDGVTTEDNEWKPLGGLRGETKLEYVKTLLAHGADPNARTVTNPRYEGAGTSRGRGSVIGFSPFQIAARASDVAVMRALLDSGANPQLLTSDNTTALMLAAGLGGSRNSWATEEAALEAVKLMVDLGADVNAANATGDTALHGAAFRGWDSIVRFLVVDKGADMNMKNQYRWTPLTIAEGVDGFAAGLSDSPSTAKLLRELGAEPTPPDVERNPSKL